MELSRELLKQFAQIANGNSNKKQTISSYMNATTVVRDGVKFVQIDGSDQLTPVSETMGIQNGDRVLVTIENHQATVIGNYTYPADARTANQAKTDAEKAIQMANTIIATSITVETLEAAMIEAGYLKVAELLALAANVETLEADTIKVKDITAEDGEFSYLSTNSLNASYATVAQLEAANAKIEEIEAGRITADEIIAAVANVGYIKATDITASNGSFNYLSSGKLDAKYATIVKLEALEGSFDTLNAIAITTDNLAAKVGEFGYLKAKDAEITYANVNFSNIGEAAMENFYANSGLIENVVISNGTITGDLIGVTISGDLIKGNTIVADKLVVKGDNGLYYKLNVDGESVEAKQTEYNSLNGSVIIAKSITAGKIKVDDLVAFDATIGGFNITESSIYSGVKESVNNTTKGIYLDKEGQVAFGDGSNYIKYFKDTDNNFKLEISARSINLSSSNKSVEIIVDEMEKLANTANDNASTALSNASNALSAVEDLETRANSGEFAGEDATTLRIDSSRGTVFKNSEVSTVLSAVIYKGSKRITDITALREEYGTKAYLEWSWQRMDESSFGVILSTDSRIGNDGFTFTLSPDDVDTKVVFMCQLIV